MNNPRPSPQSSTLFLESGSGQTQSMFVASLLQKYPRAKELGHGEIYELSLQLQSERPLGSRVVGLLYATADAILAVGDNAMHKVWKWTGMVTSHRPPVCCKECILEGDTVDVPLFLAFSGNYLAMSSAGVIYILNLETLKCITKLNFSATVASFYPNDSSMIVLGSKYGGIHVCNSSKGVIKTNLKGHKGTVTSLAFSEDQKVLVSAGHDAKLCAWSPQEKMGMLVKTASQDISGGSSVPAWIRVHFDKLQKHVFAVQEKEITICKTPKLQIVRKWVPTSQSTPRIEDLTFSSDGNTFYIVFEQGIVGVLTGKSGWQSIELTHLIKLSEPSPSRTWPLVIAGHPLLSSQFAVGLSDGTVRIIEPASLEGKRGKNLDLNLSLSL